MIVLEFSSTQVSAEASHGLIGALLKDALFNKGRLGKAGGNDATGGNFILPPV